MSKFCKISADYGEVAGCVWQGSQSFTSKDWLLISDSDHDQSEIMLNLADQYLLICISACWIVAVQKTCKIPV